MHVLTWILLIFAMSIALTELPRSVSSAPRWIAVVCIVMLAVFFELTVSSAVTWEYNAQY